MFFYAGSTFEEYVTLADYKPKSEGELSVKAGEVVKVINREATGKKKPTLIVEHTLTNNSVSFIRWSV